MQKYAVEHSRARGAMSRADLARSPREGTMAPSVPTSPRSARKQFGTDLRRRRDARGLSAEEVGIEIGCSGSKISRIETGDRSAHPDDFGRLMDFFDVPEAEQDHLQALFRAGRRRSREWWHAYGDVLSKNYADHIAHEADSDGVDEVQQLFIPAMAQTEAYARAVTSTGYAALGPDQIDALVEVKMKRQNRILSDDPLRFRAVITEAALRFECGGREAHLEQLRHLRELMRKPHFELRVIPFAKGESGMVTGGYTLFKKDDQANPTAAFAEAVTGNIFIDDDLGLRRLSRLYTYLSESALTREETITLIEETEKELTP
ncbi:helix-turn-helix domain-containing protein [Streptomyces sp. NPDC051555]|uniref:helix-turn-helix domain-containing protein n=1 Tax=Streptomyces sp. NPDC051555 TaxID=3365657 RepID=UPI0037A0C8CD